MSVCRSVFYYIESQWQRYKKYIELNKNKKKYSKKNDIYFE